MFRQRINNIFIDYRHRFVSSPASYAMAALSGIIFALIMFIMVADGTMRYLFSAPIFGASEIIEFVMVFAIMLALPHCAATDSHIRVDIFDKKLGKKGQNLADIFSGIVSMVVLGFLCYRTILKGAEAYEYQDLTALLKLPLWPLYGIIVVGMAGYFLVLFRKVVSLILKDTK